MPTDLETYLAAVEERLANVRAVGTWGPIQASQADVRTLGEALRIATVGLRACGHVHGSDTHHCNSCSQSLAELDRIARAAMEANGG